jgi:alpha-glucosidase
MAPGIVRDDDQDVRRHSSSDLALHMRLAIMRLMATIPWWQSGVVYQVYPRSFHDASGDGVGDLAGVVAKLDYLSDTLGVDAIWLSPFYPSPMADFGYDISEYCDVDPLFGDLATFDALVAAAHERGIRIVVDYVPNHTSDQHPWFRSARASRESPYRDWYVWHDPQPDGSPPNNWLAVFGGSAWEWDQATGQYYLHSFLREQPDLNWRNPAVERAMLDVLRFWLDRGVDGFRLDAVRRIMKDPELRDNPPNPGALSEAHRPQGAYDSQRHVHDMAHADIHPLFRRIRGLLGTYERADGRPRVTIGEIPDLDWPSLCRYYGGQLDELHLPSNFGLLGMTWNARAVRALVDAYEAALPPGAWPNWVLGSHDESRVATRLGSPARARLAMMLLLTLRGTPILYYGDELGMHDVPIPPEHVRDPWGRNVPGLGLGRDPARTPMPWDRTPNAGFCPPDATPWLPLGNDAGAVNVESELADRRSMLTLTRRLLALRRTSPALSVGSYRPLDGADVPDDCFVFVREVEVSDDSGGLDASAERFLVALSFGGRERRLRLPDGRCAVLLSTHLDRTGRVDGGALLLRPTEGCIIRLPRPDRRAGRLRRYEARLSPPPITANAAQ